MLEDGERVALQGQRCPINGISQGQGLDVRGRTPPSLSPRVLLVAVMEATGGDVHRVVVSCVDQTVGVVDAA